MTVAPVSLGDESWRRSTRTAVQTRLWGRSADYDQVQSEAFRRLL